MNNPPSTPSLGDVLDLARQLTRDEAASGPTLRHRDRAVGRELADLEAKPLPQILAWLHRVQQDDGSSQAARVNGLHRLGLALLALAGLLAGWGAAAVVFFYDGTHPVNVIHVLAVFVLLPLVLLVGFAIGQLPSRLTSRVPGLGGLQDAVGLLSPGRLQRVLARRLPQQHRDTLAGWLGRGQIHRRLYGRVDRWVVVHSSQTFGLAFHVGAVASALYLVVFSDLAFAWSTTLQLDAAQLERWTTLLSTPWAWAWGSARPSAELIESTRYFRLGDGSFPAAQSPAGLGGWWPFLAMAMAVYGILPRLLTLLLTRWRLRNALRQTFLHLPGLDEVRMRLNHALVETQADEPDAGPGDAGTATPAAATSLHGRPAAVIIWAGAAEAGEATAGWLASRLGITAASWHRAGGASSLDADGDALRQATATGEALLVLVKAWEPPMAELTDFLRAMRQAAGQDRRVHVLPVGPTAGGSPTLPEARHHDVWRRALARLGDPWLGVITSEGERS